MSEVSRRHVLTVVLEIERLEVTSRDWRDAAVFVSLLSDIGQQRTENGNDRGRITASCHRLSLPTQDAPRASRNGLASDMALAGE